MKKYQKPIFEISIMSEQDVLMTSATSSPLQMNDGLDDCKDYADWDNIFKPSN